MARKSLLFSLAFVLIALFGGFAYHLSRYDQSSGEEKYIHRQLVLDFEWQDGLKSARLTDPVTNRELSLEELPEAIHTDLLERVAALVRRANVHGAKGTLRCTFIGYEDPFLPNCGYDLVEPDMTRMNSAVTLCNVKLLQQELHKGIEVNTRGFGGRTALFLACLQCDPSFVKLLLDAGADPNIADDDGYTNLIWTASAGKAKIVATLLAAGADVNAGNRYGDTALSLARERGHEQVVELLKNHGAQE